MLKQLAEDYHNSLYHTPANERDLEDFAKVVLTKFIEELENNKQTVAWNYGCDSIVFANRDLNDKESLKTIKERYLGDGDD